MKNVIIVLLCFLSLGSFAQDFSNLKSIPLNSGEACKKAEPRVLEACNYLLSTPTGDNINSLHAASFVMSWMESTPAHSFELGSTVLQEVASDTNLMSRYLAAMSATAIAEGTTKGDAFKVAYLTAFLNYCEKTEHKVKLNGKLKKFIKAKNDGKLGTL